MMRRKFLGNKAGAFPLVEGIIAILLALLLAGSEVAYYSIYKDGYRLDLDSDCLPEELIDLVLEDGCGFETIIYSPDMLLETEEHTRFTEIGYVTGQLFETELIFPENDYTSEPVYIYEYVVTAFNGFDLRLFSLHVRGTFIDTGLVRPPYYDRVMPYADSYASFPFKLIWHINYLDKDHNGSDNQIYAEGQFLNRFTRETVNLWASISYDTTGNCTEATGDIEI